MNFKSLSFVAIAASLLSAAGAAHADAPDITVVKVEVGNEAGGFGTTSVGTNSNLWTTPIILTDSTGKTYLTFCDDIPHHIYVGDVNYGFKFDYVTTTEAGYQLGGSYYNPTSSHAVSLAISNLMGQIAVQGLKEYQLYKSSAVLDHEKAAVGAQLAIWSLEYGIKPADITADAQVWSAMNTDLSNLMNSDHTVFFTNGAGQAWGLFSTDSTRIQGQILGFNSAAPEPAAWALMMVGVGGMGAALRTRRRKAIAAA